MSMSMSMSIRTRLRIAALTLLLLLGVALNSAHAKDTSLLTLSSEHFKDTATVTDDPITGTTTISTEPGFVEHTGPMRMVWHDEYLRGVIDRKTGQKSFQVSGFVIYGGSLRSYETANYATANGPRSVKVTELHKSVENCATGDCTYTERIAFPVDEELLRQLAAGDAPGKPSLWHFTLIARSGSDYAGELSTAEIAGLLAKVDETTNTVPVVKANATNAALQHALGIEGIPVAATAEQPNRAGILIAGVNSGSVAQKAGIIIGDIVYEFDGHPITTLAELQSAVAASAANSKIPLRLYRGTNSITVTAQF
jgi:hypothetical protein